ncbi:MAG: Stp1/IreP family PP2C-type Ser/Thr phosphatase [Acidimicrobiales bacterium]
MSRLKTAAATHTGYLRTTNQDLALATTDLAAVADGMGGHVGGEVAARIAVEHLLEAYRRDRTTEGLLAAVQDANHAIYHRSKSDRNLRGMGTTLTAVAVVGEEPEGQVRLALVNVGDSRGYLLDRPEQSVHKLTEDHSVVEEMVRSGELTPEEAFVHPHKHILTRALGIEAEIEADCWELDLDPGSRLLLCSDGLTNELGESEIAQVLLEREDLEAAANELVRLALQRGGIDNVTVVVLEVVAGESSSVSDDVVLLPEALGGTPEPAVAGESGAITEAIALTPLPSAPESPAHQPDPRPAPLGGHAAVQTKVSGAAPAATPVAKPAYTRPLVLVPQKKKRRRERGDRIFTIRVALFVLLFVAVLGGASGVVVWFNNASFFVGLDRGYVAIFQGRPGGMLWFKPAVVERTTLKPSDLLASNAVYLRQGMEESSYQAARSLVRNLSLERSRLAAAESVTTTTVAPPTTSTSPSSTSSTVVTTTSLPATTTTSLPVVATTTTTVVPVTSVNTKSVGGATPTSVATSTSTTSLPATTTSTLPSAGTTSTTGAK